MKICARFDGGSMSVAARLRGCSRRARAGCDGGLSPRAAGKPATPAGFPALVIPGAILIGIAAALATDDNNAEFPAGTTGTGTR